MIKILIMSLMVAGALANAETVKSEYPLSTCVISGETLGDMGDPFIYKYKGVEVRFCCKGCVKDFQKEPEKYLEVIKKASDEAVTAERPSKDERAGHQDHADTDSK